jgi:hypothetical protein
LQIGVVPQDNNLDPDFTVRDNLIQFARYFDIPKKDAREKATELLDFIALGHRSNAPVTELSGGMMRRLVLARSLINDPDLLVLDEPTTGLHLADITRLLGVLRRLVEAGNSVVVIEHNLELIKTADWVIDLGPEGGQYALWFRPGEPFDLAHWRTPSGFTLPFRSMTRKANTCARLASKAWRRGSSRAPKAWRWTEPGGPTWWYVVDAATQVVQLFDPEGRLLMYFGQAGSSTEGELYLPAAVKVDYDNVGLFQKKAAPGFKLEASLAKGQVDDVLWVTAHKD